MPGQQLHGRIRLGLVAVVVGGAIVAACQGTIGGDEPKPPAEGEGEGEKNKATTPVCTGEISPGPSPLRRLTNREFDNTVRDLLGDATAPGRDFAEAGEALGFDNNADILNVTDLLAEQYMHAAEGLAERATADLPRFVGCDAAKDDCVRAFVERFGQRAFRRPLTAQELDRLVAFNGANRAVTDTRTAVQMTVQAMLQSPHFLYRVELGVPSAGAAWVPLTDWEMASRLSYLVWGSMPDEQLFAAAGAGKLRTKEQVLAQAERMLADPKARDMIVDFHDQWLRLRDIDTLDKNTTVYPSYRPELRPLWRRETEEFVTRTVLDENGSFATLLTANHTYLNGELAAFYGVGGPTGDAWTKVPLDPKRSTGFLTHAGHLAALSKPNQSSPVHRGKFVREQILCQQLPPPPPNVDVTPPELDPTLTTRQRFAEHSKNAACKGCHHLMDPMGLGFEHYDGVGKWRDDEGGLAIDDSGRVEDADLADPAFQGAPALAAKLAASTQVQHCVTSQWFRYAFGRAETDADACALQTVRDRFAATGGNVKALILALTQTDTFMVRPSGGK